MPEIQESNGVLVMSKLKALNNRPGLRAGRELYQGCLEQLQEDTKYLTLRNFQEWHVHKLTVSPDRMDIIDKFTDEQSDEELERSIREIGLLQAPIIDENTGMVVIGKRRVSAIRKLAEKDEKIKHVTVGLEKFRTSAERKLVNVAENLHRTHLPSEILQLLKVEENKLKQSVFSQKPLTREENFNNKLWVSTIAEMKDFYTQAKKKGVLDVDLDINNFDNILKVRDKLPKEDSELIRRFISMLNRLTLAVMQSADDEVNKLKSELAESENRINYLRGERDKYLNGIRKYEQEKGEIESQIEQLKSKILELETQQHEIKEDSVDYSALESELQSLREELAEKEQEYIENRTYLKKLKEKIKVVEEEKDNLLSEVQNLKAALEQAQIEKIKIKKQAEERLEQVQKESTAKIQEAVEAVTRKMEAEITKKAEKILQQDLESFINVDMQTLTIFVTSEVQSVQFYDTLGKINVLSKQLIERIKKKKIDSLSARVFLGKLAGLETTLQGILTEGEDALKQVRHLTVFLKHLFTEENNNTKKKLTNNDIKKSHIQEVSLSPEKGETQSQYEKARFFISFRNKIVELFTNTFGEKFQWNSAKNILHDALASCLKEYGDMISPEKREMLEFELKQYSQLKFEVIQAWKHFALSKAKDFCNAYKIPFYTTYSVVIEDGNSEKKPEVDDKIMEAVNYALEKAFDKMNFVKKDYIAQWVISKLKNVYNIKVDKHNIVLLAGSPELMEYAKPAIMDSKVLYLYVAETKEELKQRLEQFCNKKNKKNRNCCIVSDFDIDELSEVVANCKDSIPILLLGDSAWAFDRQKSEYSLNVFPEKELTYSEINTKKIEGLVGNILKGTKICKNNSDLSNTVSIDEINENAIISDNDNCSQKAYEISNFFDEIIEWVTLFRPEDFIEKIKKEKEYFIEVCEQKKRPPAKQHYSNFAEAIKIAITSNPEFKIRAKGFGIIID